MIIRKEQVNGVLKILKEEQGGEGKPQRRLSDIK